MKVACLTFLCFLCFWCFLCFLYFLCFMLFVLFMLFMLVKLPLITSFAILLILKVHFIFSPWDWEYSFHAVNVNQNWGGKQTFNSIWFFNIFLLAAKALRIKCYAERFWYLMNFISQIIWSSQEIMTSRK